MENKNWVTVLRKAQEQPELFGGLRPGAHIRAVVDPIRQMWEIPPLVSPSPAFVSPGEIMVWLSPTHYCVRCESGPLHAEIERRVDWGNCDVLFDALSVAGGQLVDEFTHEALRKEEEWLFTVPQSRWVVFGTFACPLFHADPGMLAIRTREGVWCQTYKLGWPVTPPILVDTPSSIGLVVAGALRPTWFPELPFVLEQVESALPQVARPYVRLEYRTDDNLVTMPVLELEKAREWL